MPKNIGYSNGRTKVTRKKVKVAPRAKTKVTRKKVTVRRKK